MEALCLEFAILPQKLEAWCQFDKPPNPSRFSGQALRRVTSGLLRNLTHWRRKCPMGARSAAQPEGRAKRHPDRLTGRPKMAPNTPCSLAARNASPANRPNVCLDLRVKKHHVEKRANRNTQLLDAEKKIWVDGKNPQG